MDTKYRDRYNFQQANDSRFVQTNCVSGYEANEAKSSQEHQGNSKSDRNVKIIFAKDIKKWSKAYSIQKTIQIVTFSSLQAETTWKRQISRNASRRQSFLYQHPEW